MADNGHPAAPRKPNLLVAAGIDFSLGCAGTQYLLDELSRWFAVEVYVLTRPEQAAWYARLPYPCRVFPFWGTRWTDGPLRIMSKAFRLALFLKLLRARYVLATEATYLREAAWAKRLRGGRQRLAQFCQELYLPEEYPLGSPKGRWSETQRKYAGAPDVVIDVDPFRAAIRQQAYELPRKPYVLRNTFPLAQLPPPAASGELWRLAGIAPPSAGIPVLVHAGGIGSEKPLERVVDAVAALDRPVFLLAFCAASEPEIQRVRDYAARKLAPDRFCFRPPVPREALRARLWEADVGVVDYAYSSEPTSNQKHCAPTKLYEYLACGLAVLGSDNDSLRDVVEREGVGRCARGEEPRDLGRALDELLSGDLAEMKARARRRFAETYSYERCCRAEVAAIARDLLGAEAVP